MNSVFLAKTFKKADLGEENVKICKSSISMGCKIKTKSAFEEGTTGLTVHEERQKV